MNIYYTLHEKAGIADAYRSIGDAYSAYFDDLESALRYYEMAFEVYGTGGFASSALKSNVENTKRRLQERELRRRLLGF
jgi:hypothetical protein